MGRIFQIALVVAYCLCSVANAQDVTANLKPGYGTVEDTFTLTVTVSGKTSNNATAPVFESSPDFSLEALATSTTTQVVNGDQSFQLNFVYRVYPSTKLKPGTYQLPKGKIEVNGQQHRLENIKITILFNNDRDSNTGVSGRTGPIDFAQVVDNLKPFVGEQVIYKSELASALPVAKAKLSDIPLDNFLRESFGKGQERRRQIGGTVVFTLAEPLFPTAAGKVTIPRRDVSAELRAPRKIPGIGNIDILDDFFAELDPLVRGATTTRKASAKPIQMEIRPLPTAPADAKQSYFPVGALKITSSISNTSVKQGEAVKLTIDVVSDGNLKPFDLNLSSLEGTNFTAFVDSPELEQINSAGEKLISRKTFSVSLVTKKAGSIKIPPISFYYFDPKAERYEKASTDEYKLIVLPTPGATEQKGQNETVSTQKTEAAEDPAEQHTAEPPTDSTPMLRDNGISVGLFWTLLVAGPALVLLKLLLPLLGSRTSTGPSVKQEMTEILTNLKQASDKDTTGIDRATVDTKRALRLIRSSGSELGLSSADVALLAERMERTVYAPSKSPADFRAIVKDLEKLSQ